MFCTKCGTDLKDGVKFCNECGSSTGHATSGHETGGRARSERLTRLPQEGKIAGVCAGFARYFGVDVTLMRIIWVALCLCPLSLLGVVGYVVAWIVMPKEMPPIGADQMHPANG